MGDSAALTDTVIRKIAGTVQEGVLEIDTILTATQVALNRFDKAASVHYQAFHQR